MWLNLRGPSGSGKSYPGFCLFRDYGPGAEIRSVDYFGKDKDKNWRPLTRPKLVGHLLPGGLVLAGRYVIQKSTRIEGAGYTGGVDGWHPIDDVTQLLDDMADRWPHGFCESLMLSGTFPRWNDWADRHQPVTFATLDTPLEKCVERVMQRNGGRPVKEDQMASNRRSVVRAARKFAEAGQTSVIIDHRYSYEQVRQLLLDGGWDPDSSSPPEGPITLERSRIPEPAA